MRQRATLDRWGIWISSLCLVHCLALPLLLAFLPALAAWIPGEHRVHAALIAIALPITGTALLGGYRRHRQPAAMLLGTAGLATVASALWAASHDREIALTLSGGLLIAAAHVANMRLDDGR